MGLLNFISQHIFSDRSISPEDAVESLDLDVAADLPTNISSPLWRRSFIQVEKSFIPKRERIFSEDDFSTKAVVSANKDERIILNKIKLKIRFFISLQWFASGLGSSFLDWESRSFFYHTLKTSKIDLLFNCSAKLVFRDQILPIF